MIKNEKQSLGEFFRETRKDKGISIDEIVRDTNIPKRYLESIESDSFDVFPGETYAIGFVTNYADALEVDRDLVISLYKRQMKIEQDSPIEQLVGKKKQFIPNMNMLIIVGVIIISFIFILLISYIINRNSPRSNETENSNPRIYTYTFDDINKISNQKFKIGDSITISNESKSISLSFISVNASHSLLMKINSLDYNMKSGDLLSIDSDRNGTNDLGIELFSAKEKDIKLSITLMKENFDSNSMSIQDDLYNKYREYILSEDDLFTSKTRTNIDLKIVMSGNSWISYIPDNKEEKEMNLNNGSTITINFINNLVLYLGNSGAAKIIVGNKEEDGGGWGEVNKSLIYWKTKNGQFTLVRGILK